jgi:putative glutathione S-transferase
VGVLIVGRWHAGEDDVPRAADGFRHPHEPYGAARPANMGRITVPVPWDERRGTIVNSESAEIARLFGAAFADAGGA